MELLEREAVLDLLGDAVAGAAVGAGRVVIIEGPPGIGKSAVVERFLQQADVRTISGRCDELSIPRTLGPFVDAAVRGELAVSDVASTDALGRTLLTTLADTPTAIVIDDAQWADAATADIIRLVARRIDELRCVLVLAMRDGDLSSSARLAVGAGPSHAVVRVVLEPLTRAAVEQLAPPDLDIDIDGVLRSTGGIPFLTVELFRSPDDVSGTIRQRAAAALAATGRTAQRLAAMLSVSPEGLRWDVVEHVADDWPAAIDELERAGLVQASDPGVRFVHDLMRRAVESDLSGAHRRRYHVELLEHLVAVGAEPAVIAHHANEVNDVGVLITSSVDAARAAAEAGAHFEALRHVERVLTHVDRLDHVDRGHLYEIAAVEYQLNLRLDDALTMARRRLALAHVRDDPTSLSAAYRTISRIEWARGDASASREHLDLAREVLDGHVAPTELVRRYVDVATDLAMNSRWDDAATWVGRALVAADESVDPRSYAQAHGASELIRSVVGDPEAARRDGDRAIAVFRRDGIHRDLTITLGNRVANALNTLRLDEYPAAIADATAAVAQDDSVATEGWFTGLRARYALLCGEWSEAARLADAALEANPYGLHRAGPLVCRALLRTRCGQDGGTDLAEARALLDELSDIQRIGYAATAAAEIAWLGGAFDSDFFDRAVALARTSGHRRYHAELVMWQRRLGRFVDDDVAGAPPPLQLELDGHWNAAADAWGALGCPYERALSLAFSGDVDAMQEAAQTARVLGAGRTNDRIRQQLRTAGVSVARGPRAATRANPAGLTSRQFEVARLLTEGLTNDEIAARLFVSAKTVDHHVSAVLTKLDVAGRREVAARLVELARDP